MGGIIYVVGGELESQILANVEALDARACFLNKGQCGILHEPRSLTRELEFASLFVSAPHSHV
jgi:hypothetical protein